LKGNEILHARLAAIKDGLGRAGIRWGVFAGAAAYCYGSRREVTDIDILVRVEDLHEAKIALKNINIDCIDVVANLEIQTNHGNFRFFMDDEMVERIRWKQLFGVSIPVIPVEDNIIFKAIAQREEDQRKHDLEDLRCMIENEEIDLKYLEKRIRKFRAYGRIGLLLQPMFRDARMRRKQRPRNTCGK